MGVKNVFISHYSGDDENIRKIKNLVKPKGYELRNSSIDSTKPNNASNEEYVKSLLRPRISWAGSMVVLIGPKTHERSWVNWEIEQAAKLGKDIIGVYLHGASESDLPEAFDEHGTALLGWRADRLIEALEGKFTEFQTPDGSPRQSRWDQQRETC